MDDDEMAEGKSVVVIVDKNVNSDPAPPPYKAVRQESDGTPAASLRCLGGIGWAAQSKARRK